MSNWSNQAEHDAAQAMRRAWLHDVLHWLRGESNELIPFDAVKDLNPLGEHYVGIQTIEVDAIIGSVDRYRDFDDSYLPKSEHNTDRWVNIRRLQLEGKSLPAIQVYKVGETYFVKDGNHRVSVAALEGQKFIDAEVIELDVIVPPERGDDLKDLIIKGEYAKFLIETKLEILRPEHSEIMFSTPGRYDILLEHVKTRQYFLGLNLQRDVSWEEAVTSWYDKLYSHMITEIRNSHALESFVNRTEADLYLWMMDHRYFLTEKFGEDVGSKITAESFVKHHAPNLLERFKIGLKNLWAAITRRLERTGR
jgi:hypothetical protein